MSDNDWLSAGDFQKRTYNSYDEYAMHQAEKLGKLNLANYEQGFYKELSKRLEPLKPSLNNGKSVLCLGARTGIECRVFIDMGCVAVGIDLSPGSKNSYVLHGDFHNLQFADKSADCVFTNALDHAFDLERVLGEVRRVLKPGGMFIAEIVDPSARGPGDYESLWWKDLATVVNAILAAGFTLREQRTFLSPWQGAHCIFINETY